MVYGTLLNDSLTLQRLAGQFGSAPYKAPPIAPVLYIKPTNTHRGDGAAVTVPCDTDKVRVEATVGAVISRDASCVSEEAALSFVEGYVIVSDLSVPHDVYYRPSIKQRCRDGFCPVGPLVQAGDFDVTHAELTVAINGEETMRRNFSTMARPIARLLADVTEFMTLRAGDILLLGLHDESPVAGAGDLVRIEVTGLGALNHSLVAERA